MNAVGSLRIDVTIDWLDVDQVDRRALTISDSALNSMSVITACTNTYVKHCIVNGTSISGPPRSLLCYQRILYDATVSSR